MSYRIMMTESLAPSCEARPDDPWDGSLGVSGMGPLVSCRWLLTERDDT